ncbi:MAG: hypothetical protein IPM25_13210 [Chloracidobacterium sp.]|nr:hypothetical protein [Chloracidobacterium sp.]
MTRTYLITDAQFAEARSLIESNGGTIGNDSSFEVYGVQGHFERNGDSIAITVTKKPILATWKKIEKALDGFFS